jgi:hypothetical protein
MPSRDEVPKQFYALMSAMIDSLAEVFNECPALKSKKVMFAMFKDNPAVWPKAVTEWDSTVTPEAREMIRTKNPELFTVFDKHALLSDVGLSAKWADAGLCDDSRETLWWYITKLTELSTLYCGGGSNGGMTVATADGGAPPMNPKLAGALAAAGNMKQYGFDYDAKTGEVKMQFEKIAAALGSGNEVDASAALMKNVQDLIAGSDELVAASGNEGLKSAMASLNMVAGGVFGGGEEGAGQEEAAGNAVAVAMAQIAAATAAAKKPK